MRVAVDAMGGDHAPGEVVRGSAAAVEARSDLEVILVGHKDRIQPHLDALTPGTHLSRIRVVHATEVVDMSEHPVEALRRKPDNSVLRSLQLVKRGEADAVATAGHTGAAVAGATLTLGMLEGVRRPGICVTFPTQAGVATLMDVGANIKCRPIHLVQYGIMGSAYARAILSIEDPRVGLLNIGEEAGKGTDLIQETHRLFAQTRINFRGNAEAHDVYVTEGFAGNLILKVAEGFGASLMATLKRELVRHLGESKDLLAQVITRIEERVDYAEYGGALLLGVNGVVVIAHGRSEARAIANAVRVAAEFAGRNVNRTILDEVRGMNRVAAETSDPPGGKETS